MTTTILGAPMSITSHMYMHTTVTQVMETKSNMHMPIMLQSSANLNSPNSATSMQWRRRQRQPEVLPTPCTWTAAVISRSYPRTFLFASLSQKIPNSHAVRSVRLSSRGQPAAPRALPRGVLERCSRRGLATMLSATSCGMLGFGTPRRSMLNPQYIWANISGKSHRTSSFFN